MGRMARARQGSIVATVVVALLLGGCTEPPAGDGPPADPESVALRITTATGDDKLAEDQRTDVESAIGEVLSAYVVQAFLGDHPRTGYLQALDGFTDVAAELAAGDLEVLTAAGIEDLTAVRATRLDSDLSLYVVDGDPLGVTAWVTFDFDATLADDEHPAADPAWTAAADPDAGRLGGLRLRRPERRRHRPRGGPVVTALLRLARLAVVLAVALLVVPAGGVRPAAITLTTVDRAEGVDVSGRMVWVLVLGEDVDGRTDAIQLVGLDARTGAATAIGIPRDSWVELPDGSEGRINTAYPDHGPDAITQIVSELVGITPDYLAVVDFAAFEALLGEVGPVTLTSPQGFESHGVVVREGVNTFDPSEALAYVRHRLSFVDQDFSRSANQQRLMGAALAAYQSLADDPGFVEAAALAALGVVDTDLTPSALYRLAQAFTAVDTRRLTGCVLPGDPGMEGEASVVYVDEEAALRIGADAADDAVIERRTCDQLL